MKAQVKKRSGYQKKLEPKAEKGVLVGYNYDRDFTHKIFMPEARRVTYRREVIFEETRSCYESNDNLDYSRIDEYMIEIEAGDTPIVNHRPNPNSAMGRIQWESKTRHRRNQPVWAQRSKTPMMTVTAVLAH